MAQTIKTLQARTVLVEETLLKLKAHLQRVSKAKVEEYCSRQEVLLRRENAALERQVTDMCQQLRAVEVSKGIKQMSLPADRRPKVSHSEDTGDSTPAKQSRIEQPKAGATQAPAAEPTKAPKEKKASKGKAGAAEGKGSAKGGTSKKGKGGGEDSSKPVDISRLVMRAGRITDVKKHPDADSLYLETVDVGEERPRTIISGLVKHYTLEEMQNRLAIFVCNLKPAKMRGILSEGMIMCASSPKRVQIIDLPPGAQVGDRVVFSKFTGEPDDKVDAKKKVWEQLLPGLRTDSKGVATYLGDPFTVEGREGVCVADKCPDYPIK